MSKINALLKATAVQDAKTDAIVAKEIDKLFKHQERIEIPNELGRLMALTVIADSLETTALKKYGASIYNIYCAKTGQPIGVREAIQVRMLCELHEITDIKEMLPYITASSCAAHWLATDGVNLGRLETIDPIGYFVYAASICMRPYAEGYNVHKRIFESHAFEQAYNRQKIALWHALDNFVKANGINSIRQANEAWAIFLAQFDPKQFNSKVKFPFTQLIEFAEAEIIASVASALRVVSTNAYRALLVGRKYVEMHSHALRQVADNLYENGGGRSNFRGQIAGTTASKKEALLIDFEVSMMRAGVVLSNSAVEVNKHFNNASLTPVSNGAVKASTGAAFAKGFNLAVRKEG